jgi:glutaminase
MVEAGDSQTLFTLMSVAKPFVFALVCARIGLEAVRELVGLNATGRPFNSIEAVERGAGGRTNPMVNPGAIATTSLTPGTGVSQRWSMLQEGLSQFAGRSLAVDDGTLDSALATNHRNRALANLLASFGSVHGDPDEAVQLYTRQSCLAVTAVDLAVMGTTLASGGINPLTRERVVDAETAHHTLAVMTIAGLYETSGDWLIDIGVPGKSGIGGGIVTVSPGKGALGTFSPLLDAAGNSVRGQLAARFLSRGLGLDVFAADGGRAPDGA